MTYDQKIQHATKLLRYFPEPRAVLSSFGKESMVLLHLIRETLPKSPLNTHSFPIPVIHYRHPWFPQKNEFADKIIRSWGLEIHTFLPMACGMKAKPDRIEVVSRYPFGSSGIDLPLNTEEPLKRQDYACGLQWMLQPKAQVVQFPWDTVYHGHKSADIDPFEGNVPLKHDAEDVGGVSLVFPLRHWTDDDVWQYIEENHVEYDKRRYAGRLEVPNRWLNPDYLHACTKCVDPRNVTDKEVICPKTGKPTPNVGPNVLRLDLVPEYIERKEHATA